LDAAAYCILYIRTTHRLSKWLTKSSRIVASPFSHKTHPHIARLGITWKFIAPRAAWWRGWWERMIGTTKRCLRKVLGRLQGTDEELASTLVSIEAALNSRPIIQDVEDALTRAHFLCGAKLTTLPSTTEPQRVVTSRRHTRGPREWSTTFGDVRKRNNSWS
jgi:hypothetical protein